MRGQAGAAVDITRLSVSYRRDRETVPALADVSLHLDPGTTCAVIGPSGCGKSTLLYVLAGLHPPTDGRVLVNGGTPRRRQTAIILQDYGLLPWKTVWHNTVLGLVIRRASRARIRAAGERVLKEMGLWEMRDRYPATLSGGQRQRVAIARSLAVRPDLLLMDEPFSSLDALTREALQETLLDVLQDGSLTLVLVTHNIEEAAYLGRRIAVLTPHPGRLFTVLENRSAGSRDYRKTDEFYRLCRNLRSCLEDACRTGSPSPTRVVGLGQA